MDVWDWVCHFILSTLALSLAYYTNFAGFLTQECSKREFWDKKENKLRIILNAKNIQITSDCKFVKVSGVDCKEQKKMLCDFEKHYSIIRKNKSVVLKFKDRGMVLLFTLIISIFYSGIMLLINNPELTFAKVGSVFATITGILILVLVLIPVFDAKNKLDRFIEDQEEQEAEKVKLHGEFNTVTSEKKR
jgi:hypothetical protein